MKIGAIRDWTAPRINPTRLPMYFSPRYGAKTRSGSRCQSLAMPNGWCRMHRDLRPALRRGIRSSARHGRRCGLHVRCWPFRDVLIPPNGRFAPQGAITSRRHKPARAHSGNPAFRSPSINSFEFECPPRAIYADIVKAGSCSNTRAAASRASTSRPRWAKADARQR